MIEALIMYYNTDLLDEAPETFEELEALSEDDQYACKVNLVKIQHFSKLGRFL